ncbi:MAG: translational GTPase TypA [Candidatus Pacebacteria bacterium]|nr:translational GTPase TypA [Candidatus Paceibacterota bacterium]
MEIRNIAIIAHVDHGKTTLVDSIMRQMGMTAEGASMDSNDLEKERGITIYAKNTSLFYKDTKINIVDTPGHADFGSEVERVLRSIDSVLLLVDAQEGPMPQTRFVLKKSLELGIQPIVVINKIDKPAANPARVHDEVLELFIELGAKDEQIEFKTIYAIGRDGVAIRNLDDARVDTTPLLDLILEEVKPANKDTSQTDVPKAQVFNLGYDNFLGRLGIVRVYSGELISGSMMTTISPYTETKTARITKLFTFNGLERKEVQSLVAGDIGIVAGFTDVSIGETIVKDATTEPMPAIAIDEPTITLNFLVNDSPFAGREGKFVTSRQIRDRLERELEINVGLKVTFDQDVFYVSGRGELHISVLLEQMRREGYELQVSQPQVITKIEDGHKMEPFEEVTIDVPTEFSGAVIEKLTKRKGLIMNMFEKEGSTRILIEMPTRGLLGYRSQFVVDTKGEGILAARFLEFRAHAGEIEKRDVGSMISMITGAAAGYALANLQDRGILYIGHAEALYEGMVIGNTSKGEDMIVNAVKGKQLTNVRASGTDEAIYLKPPMTLSIERGLEVMNADEYLEITPKSVRLRKKYLTETERNKAGRGK